MGGYLLRKFLPSHEGYAVNVEDLKVDKPLILPSEGKVAFQIDVSYQLEETFATMEIYGVDSKGSKTSTHARCVLHLEDSRAWPLEWEKNQYLISRSMEWLRRRHEDTVDSHLSKGMIYKMFSSLVEYGPGFMGLQSVIFNSGDYEATAKVKLQPAGGNFVRHPMWIDSFGQLAGFMMNSHHLTPADQVFVNHGWRTMRCLKDFREDAEYQAYVRMRCIDGTTYAGDVYVMEADTIVAVYGGITVSNPNRAGAPISY